VVKRAGQVFARAPHEQNRNLQQGFKREIFPHMEQCLNEHSFFRCLHPIDTGNLSHRPLTSMQTIHPTLAISALSV
jgi:hypothetical protein